MIGFIVLFVMAISSNALVESQKGVIVEAVTGHFEAEKARLQPGDVILHWTRADAQGDIDSPFDFVQLEVEQRPRGLIVLEGLRGTEKQTWTLGPGIWGLKVRPELAENLLSTYRNCQALSQADRVNQSTEVCQPVAVTRDPLWLSSWFALQAADALSGAGQWTEAENAYQIAVQHGKQAGPLIVASLLNRWAAAYEARGDLQNAERRYQESFVEHQKSALESLAVAADLNGLGSVARKRGDLAKAEEYSRHALLTEEKLAPDSLEVAISLNNLGNIAWARRDLETAEQYHRRALDIRQRLAPATLAVAGSLNNLGLIAWQRDDFDRAEDYQQRALEIRKRLAPMSMDLAASFNNLGNIAWDRGELAKAENYYRQGLEIRQKLAPESNDLADALNNLGLVVWRRGELVAAQEYYRRALLIEQKRGIETLEVANILHNLANVLWELGDRSAAEERDRQALQIREKVAPRSLEVAAGFNNLGFFARERNSLDEAETYDRRALEIENELAPESLVAGVTFHQLGDVAQARGQLAAAEKFYRRAIEIRARLAPGSTGHAETLVALARIFQHMKDWNAASTLFDQALVSIESQTARLGGAEETRYAFRAGHARYYADYIDVLFAQKEYALAFHVAERSRAQSLLEMLTAGRVDVYRGVDPGLLAQKRRLEQSISSKSSERIGVLNGKHNADQVTALNQEIEKLLDQYRRLEGQIRASAPEYGALIRPQPLNAKQVQGQLLDSDTLLLEYALGENHSHLWVVSQTSLAAYELPKQAAIEAAARRVHKLLIAPKPQSQAQLTARQSRWNLAATRLSQIVLGPVAAQIHGKRLLIVADGALQYIPFEALPFPGSSHRHNVPLVVKHEIAYLPSASVLDILRRAEKPKEKSARTVAVLADPVFDRDDARVRLMTVTQKTGDPKSQVTGGDLSSSAEHLTRSVADSGLYRLPRLPFSRREAAAILAVTPPSEGTEFLDFQASRATATGQDLVHYRVVHFATHGLLDSKHPELSGLVLSLVDPAGNSQNGFLDLQDIYNLNLDSDLVVLSACETALGKEIRGEGLIGLTRGFMYAGARRVLASLWKVDDVATAELMARFYKSMEAAGMRPSAALRRAQIEMWKQQRWKLPYYWAGFQLQGDWK